MGWETIPDKEQLVEKGAGELFKNQNIISMQNPYVRSIKGIAWGLEYAAKDEINQPV